MHRSRFRMTVVLLLLALGGASACGRDTQKDSLEGAIGPGSGGPDVGTLTAGQLAKPDGSPIGTFGYDAGFFVLTAPNPKQQGTLANPAAGVGMVMNHITGRADTPCRFSVALLARDGGFTLGETGFRTNDQGQDLYEANASAPGSYQRMYCAELKDSTGTQFAVLADAPEKLDWKQVHAVLNSVRGP